VADYIELLPTLVSKAAIFIPEHRVIAIMQPVYFN
jgi:hypothetical protein